jgi:hypothetical protein
VDPNVPVSLLIRKLALFITSVLVELLVLSCYRVNTLCYRVQYFTARTLPSEFCSPSREAATGWSVCRVLRRPGSNMIVRLQQLGPGAIAAWPGGLSKFARRQRQHGPIATTACLGQAMLLLPPGAVAAAAGSRENNSKCKRTAMLLRPPDAVASATWPRCCCCRRVMR